MAENKRINHLPVMILIALFAIIFIISLFAFQVRSTEMVVVTRLGSQVEGRDTPGLHWRLPWPIEKVWQHDLRIQIFEGRTGVYEETYTKDQKNIIVNVYTYWQVDPAAKHIYMNKIGTRDNAERQLDSILSHIKREVLSNYNFNDLIATAEETEDGELSIEGDSSVNINEVERRMKQMLGDAVRAYGIAINQVGIKYIGLPESVTQKVIARMQEDRRKIAAKTIAEGEAEASIIEARAQARASEIIDTGSSEAVQIRGRADALAVEHYMTFAQNPELAIFLRKLEGLRKTLEKETTLVFDTQTPPFDLFQKQAIPELNLQILNDSDEGTED